MKTKQPAAAAQYMTAKELAEMIGVTTDTLYQWRYRGTHGPKYSKLGGFVRYKRSDVDKWIAANERQPST